MPTGRFKEGLPKRLKTGRLEGPWVNKGPRKASGVSRTLDGCLKR
jgi:hypothetical protein